MDWMQLRVKTNKEQADLISEVLMGLGSVSTTFSDTNDDAIFEPPVGETPLWQETTIDALFEIGVDQSHIKATLSTLCGVENGVFERLEGRVWEDECKKDFHAMGFGKRLWICPSWEDASKLPSDAVVINMDPGLAFGTGTHQTTDLCLQYLDEHPPLNKSVIDYGSGTGVLAIAAAKLGATIVTAIDNDPQAVIATIDNVKTNEVVDIVNVVHSNDEGELEKVDMLIANILANPLVDLSEHLANLVQPKGRIILSGILDEQLGLVKDTYSRYFDDIRVERKDQWCRIDGVRK